MTPTLGSLLTNGGVCAPTTPLGPGDTFFQGLMSAPCPPFDSGAFNPWAVRRLSPREAGPALYKVTLGR